MKLSFEKVAPYLPYSLGIINVVGKRTELTTENLTFHLEKGFKPVLRPLEDTQTLEVDFGSEKGVFKDNYFGFTNFMFYYNEYKEFGRAYWHNRAPYVVVKRLLEYNYDVFGMIEDGLAIDINTLK